MHSRSRPDLRSTLVLLFVLVCVLVPIWLGGCQATPVVGRAVTPAGAETPLYDGLGRHRRPITTSSRLAQRYFDQGLTFMYAFNHDEAIRAFTEVTRLDPECAMAWWGIALCHGPNINNPVMDEVRKREARAAADRAIALREHASPLERELIDAASQRYATDLDADRAPFDVAYADAMREVWRRHPNDSDVATLFAESLMDLRPWDLWAADGSPRPETIEVVAALERAMAIDPSNPGANHLYVHAIEASPEPSRGIPAADRLRTLVPASGHLVHMPAHIDVRTGRWELAALQNEAAIRADEAYRAITPKQGFYQIYMLHNHHFLAYVCMMEGRGAEALAAARSMINSIPSALIDQAPPLADPYMAIEYQVLVRFGRWDEMLATAPPRADLPLTTALWRFARATAHAAKGDLDAATAEQAAFRRAVSAVPEGTMGVVNPAARLLAIAEHTLAGEIAFQRGDHDGAIRALREAVAIEDTLQYMEPPEWIQPVRHALGAVLVADERWSDAATVYREDLERWPANGWSLSGLAHCESALGDPAAPATAAAFERAWARADTRIGATCLCVLRRLAETP